MSVVGGTELRRLHTSVVPREEIDQLGHMNVRFYGVRAIAATRQLADDLNLVTGAGKDVRLVFTDLFTRWFREQLEGAPLEVWGGVLDASETKIRVYQQLINADTGELSASFAHSLELQNAATGEVVPFAPDVVDAGLAARVEWPEQSRPRSIDLEHDPKLLTLDEAKSRGLSTWGSRTIDPDECGKDGYFDSKFFFNLVWGREDDEDDDDWLQEHEGRRFGWASLESRGTLFRLPRAGDRIQSFGAVVDIGAKTRNEKFWVFDLDRGDLLCTAQIVNAAFDIGARKALVIPDKQRSELEARHHPDLL